jgi:hypothetical protein
MVDKPFKKGDKVEITKGSRAGTEGVVDDPGEFITHVKIPDDRNPVPVANYELKAK